MLHIIKWGKCHIKVEVKLKVVVLNRKNINIYLVFDVHIKTFIDMHTIKILFTYITNELVIILSKSNYKNGNNFEHYHVPDTPLRYCDTTLSHLQ